MTVKRGDFPEVFRKFSGFYPEIFRIFWGLRKLTVAAKISSAEVQRAGKSILHLSDRLKAL